MAAELALLDSPRVRSVVIADGVGIEVEGQPMTSVAGLSVAEIQQLSFHDPRKAPGGGSGPSPDIAALLAYTGPTMADPTLRARLGAIRLPVQVVWGESDGIVSPGYGKEYAAAIPGATFTVLPRTGHLPQVETPEALLEVLAA